MKAETQAAIDAESRRINERFIAERELIRSELDAMNKATQLQAGEYERRLESLNHAHEEAQRILNTYVPRETYEAYVLELARRQESTVRETEARAEVLRNAFTATEERLVKEVEDMAARQEERSLERKKAIDEALEALSGRISALREDVSHQEGTSVGISSSVAWAFGAIGVLVAIASLVISHL